MSSAGGSLLRCAVIQATCVAVRSLSNFVSQTHVHRFQAYQLFKARAYGADAVLLIAAVLPNKDLAYLIAAAIKLKLQCLVEVSY